jgi:hypothetical protein
MIETDIKGVQDKMEGYFKEFTTIHGNLSKMKEALESKANIKIVSKVQEKFREYATIVGIKEFTDKINEKIHEFNGVSDAGKDEVENIKMIVSRFDEVLGDKASKISFIELKQHVDKFVVDDELSVLKNGKSANFIFLDLSADL